MGQAKAKKDRAKRIDEMGFPEQLQYYASKIVKEANDLVDLGGAKWQEMELVGGKKSICLVFPPNLWELDGDRLVLKRAKNESDKTIETK